MSFAVGAASNRATSWARWRAALVAGGVPNADSDLRTLIEAVVEKPLFMVTNFTAKQTATLDELVERRAAREPIQHILGKQYFFGLRLEACPGVFCARVETELLVQAAVELARGTNPAGRQLPTPVRVLDLCTGSGAIALAIASQLPAAEAAQIVGLDISATAVESARRNGAQLNLPVEFCQADATALDRSWHRRFSLVTANPPYVPERQLEAEALADPPQALWGGGEEGLEIPRKMALTARQCLLPGGAFLMEHDDTQGEALHSELVEMGFEDVHVHVDLNQRDRFLSAWQPRA